MADVMFDVYGLLVENLFGSIIVSAIAMLIYILIVSLICRMSTTLILFWIALYILVFSAGYIGGLALVIGTIGGGVYFALALLRLVNPRE